MDRVFAVCLVCEKYLANRKDVFWAFTDFENVYDTIDQQGYVADADAKSVWSWRKIVESCAEFFCISYGVCLCGK